MIKVNFKSETDDKQTKRILEEIKKDKMGGWLELPRKYDVGELVRIKEAAKKINAESEYLVCIGIGGSYLGHRAVIEALRSSSETKIIFASAFSEGEEEVGGIVVFHKLPGLINDE